MPTTGTAGLSHPEMGTGAWISFEFIAAAARNTFADPITGPNPILVRLRSGTKRKALHSLQPIADHLSNSAHFGVDVVSVQRPADWPCGKPSASPAASWLRPSPGNQPSRSRSGP